MEQDVTIWERESQRLITAVFNDEVGATDLAKAESQWKPVRDAAVVD